MAIMAAAIGAGAGLLGGVLSNRSNSAQVAAANQASERSTQMQIDFQREMSNTAWQRGVKDMQAAGLNPMLAYSQGGASTPSGSSYQAQAATMQNVGSAAVAGAQQALNARSQAADIDLKKAQATQALSSAGNLDAQRDVNQKELDHLDQIIRGSKWDADRKMWEAVPAEYQARRSNVMWQQGAPQAEVDMIKARAREAASRAQIVGNEVPASVNEAAYESSSIGQASRFVRFGLNSANQATSIIKPFTSSIDEPTRGYGLR